MSDDAQNPPESLLPYDEWMEDSLRFVVLRALGLIAESDGELPGSHHFYITFRTDFPGVEMPTRLREKYKTEMTIVLQHQFQKLWVDEASRMFGVTLSFGGVPSPLVVPLGAVSAFVDPSIQFGLRFKVHTPPATEPETLPEPAPQPGAPPSEAPQVVSLDAFRKRRD